MTFHNTSSNPVALPASVESSMGASTAFASLPLAPGESRSSVVAGRNTHPSRDLTVAVRVGTEARMFTAPVARTSARVAGVLFADADGDGALDPGEELAHTVVHAVNPKLVSDAHNTTTDASGRFDFGQLGTVPYQVMPTRWPDGFTGPYTETTAAGDANLRLMGIKAAQAPAAQPGFDIAVVIAPHTTPPVTTPPTATPAPQPGASPLPNTGADVDWLAILGATAVAAGAVIVALTRKRRRA
ncbi:LPXTG cell wall anchor domain-containing protein [Actinokineospora sp. HUAS TT18]|uniref:LPXTG cell wall anchor domain-containing protein n=1 Tax=Actinokineospora sp. HUAS TT18 TaxID=3447451 RepID=UPI003F51FFBE